MLRHIIKKDASQRKPLVCDDVPAAVPRDYFALCRVWVFRKVKLLCPSNWNYPPVNESFDKGLLNFFVVLSLRKDLSSPKYIK